MATYPYSQMLVLRHTDEATILLSRIPANYLPANVTAVDYDPAKWLHQNAAPPPRFATIFSIAIPQR